MASVAKRIGKWAAVTLAVVAAIAGLGVAALVWLVDGFTTKWERPDPPTAAQVARLRAEAPHPTYWFGRRTDAPLSDAGSSDSERGALVFTYGQFCEELDLGSGLTCTDHGQVANVPRTVARLGEIGPDTGMPFDRECWHPMGRAWVLWCDGSWRATLWTADRVIEFGRPGKNIDDFQYRRPWQTTISQLQRFDAAGAGPRFPATNRFTCAERHVMSRRDRAGMPPSLRARGC